MQTFEPRSLLTDKPRIIDINNEIKNTFKEWKEIITSNKESVSELEIFFAGWILANPMARDQFKKLQGKIIEK